tara:strand:+ start:275 stop:958 length:684 start_codon:yes stop_codon:yes gene_type:complete
MIKKNVAIIQARIGSSRLKNKMFCRLHGSPIIEWVLKRVKKASLIDQLILAIPDTRENDILDAYAKQGHVTVFRGDEKNVLDRVYHAAIRHKATQVIRICADNPLICPELIDELILFYEDKQPCDYAYNHRPINNLFPDGLGAEIISIEALTTIKQKAKEPLHVEHMFNYIWDHTSSFIIKTYDPIQKERHYPHLKVDVDTQKDLDYLNKFKIDTIICADKIIELMG